jgi:hypothetical protein
MTDNLAGQLWFGAECLAAGSSIMNKETESDAMRPLAKAVTKSLEKVRALLREQCLSATHEYTENIRENLKIFDRLFADFEYNYVRCMVHVKSVKEYDLHQDLIVLFSDTLARAIKQDLISQDLVDYYDPSLMFAIPRLAIVYGLLISPDGPLCVDRSHSDFPSLFLPFKNLLRKIRELLQSLEFSEVSVLEMLLCQQEEPANIATKLKEVEHMLANKEKTEEGKAQALKLQAKLNGEQEVEQKPAVAVVQVDRPSQMQRLNSIPCQCDSLPCDILLDAAIRDIVDDIVSKVVDISLSKEQAEEEEQEQEATVEIDCTEPEIRVSPSRRTVEIDIVSPISSTTEATSSSRRCRSSKAECSQGSSQAGSSAPIALPLPSRPSRSGRSSGGGSLKRHNARRDTKRLPYCYQKDRRAKFKSTEDLIHRLYVCISGAADQLQSNYAADFRSILRVVFLINVTPDEITEETPEERFDYSPEMETAGAIGEDSLDGGTQDEAAAVREPTPPLETLPGALPDIDLATDALQHEMSVSLYDRQLRPASDHSPISSTEMFDEDTDSSNSRGGVYAQNIDLHLHTTTDEEVVTRDASPPPPAEFYQPEPTLLDIADGVGGTNQQPSSPQETLVPEAEFVAYRQQNSQNSRRQTPPAWVPDAEAPNCMGCHEGFTFVKRRHHCRACGKVYCGKCSSHFLPLPHFGLDRPVRVCNRCNLLMQPDPSFYLGTSPGSHASSDTFDGSSPNSEATNARSPPWSRNYGMVS